MRCYELDDGLTDPSERDQDGRSRGASVALERDPILRAGLLLNHPLSQQKKKKEIYIYICIDKVDGDLLREQGGDGHVDDTYFYPLTRLLSL